MNNKKAAIQSLIKNIEKIDLLRDVIQSEFSRVLSSAGELELTLKESCYINAAAAEFNDFYLEEAIEALEKAIKK